jgi:single-strand DNA-binding protein
MGEERSSSMNQVVLVGRFVKDPDVRYANTQNGQLAIASYMLAVDRPFKKDGEQTADFISCKCFGKAAEFIQKHFHKGMKIAVSGRIQTGSYEKDGVKHYTTDVITDTHEFVEKKEDNGNPANSNPAPDNFMDIPIGNDESIPFV